MIKDYFKAFATLLLFFSIYSVFAQDATITFIDGETKETIEGAYVQCSGGTSYITSSDGQISIPKQKTKVNIVASHVSYHTLTFEYSGGNRTIEMLPNVKTIKEVVVTTDPYQDVALDRDMYSVTEVNRKTIDQLGANNLSDVLNFNMNMTIIPDASTGRSTVNMFGLSGEYVKVLIDNVPVASDNGSGNNIDISQINLENIERIEVSEGAMGVRYGSNAVAGVINIISKKNVKKSWEIDLSLQEESVGSEYQWFSRGRHIQNLKAATNISDKLYFSTQLSRNDFTGFYNGYQGQYYKGTDKLRGHEWNPKEQLSASSIINYQITPSLALFYKFDIYDEQLDIYDHTVNAPLGLDGEPNHSATDEMYSTRRYVNQMNLSGEIAGRPFWVIASIQEQTRKYEDYTFDLDYQVKKSTRGLVTNQSSNVLYSKAEVAQILGNTEKINIEVGYEAEHQSGYDAIASGNYSDSTVNQKLWYTDLYMITPFTPTEAFSFTPGIRFNHNSLYGNHIIWSSTLSSEIKNLFLAKLVIGSAYKTPNFSQLYYYFVDANHDVTGNINLKPEDGISIMLDLEKTYSAGNVHFKTSLQGYHFNINDRITLLQIVDENSDGQSFTRYTYLNAQKYTNYGVTLEHQIKYKNLDWAFGGNYIHSRIFLTEENESEQISSPISFTSRAAYEIPNLNLRIGLNLKYNGPGQQFFQNGDTIEPGKLRGYTLMDTSVKKSFMEQRLALTLGARNLLNVVSVNASGLSAGSGHDGVAPTSQFFSTGRSWFLKLQYKIQPKS